MKAIFYTRYGPPDVLQIQEIEQPTAKAHEVLIKVHAAVVGTADCAARAGRPYFARLFFGLTKPKLKVLGTEFAGQIEAVGRDVTRFKVGDQVYAATGTSFGAHAEYVCLPEDGSLAIKPSNTGYAEAAAICEGALTALPFLRDHGCIQPGQSILINGASGSVGVAAVQLAKYFGAEVTGVCGNTNLELVESLGADRVIDYTQEDFTKAGQHYDVIFDAVGKSSFSRCQRVLMPRGIYLTTVLTPAILLQMLWTSKACSKKAILALTGLRQANEKAQDLVLLRDWIEAGTIRPVIDRRYTLEQAAEAHAHVDTGHKKGNVVIEM